MARKASHFALAIGIEYVFNKLLSQIEKRKHEYYKSYQANDDERFSLMEIIIQSYSEMEKELSKNNKWQETLTHLENNLDLHIYTIW